MNTKIKLIQYLWNHSLDQNRLVMVESMNNAVFPLVNFVLGSVVYREDYIKRSWEI